MAGPLAIGVDLGATKIASALVTRGGQVVATRQTPTLPGEGAEVVLDRIAAEVEALMAQSPEPVAGVGIGSPGQVSPAEGAVRYATNLGWQEVFLRDGVRSRLASGLPVWIEKDTNAGALGEHLFGAALGCHDFVYLAVGSGLGAGVFANGALISGAHNNASELGHLSLDPNGRLCTCGLQGCAETVVSGPGLLAVASRLLAEGQRPTALGGPEALTTGAIIGAARAGDPVALAALGEVAAWLGLVMAVCAAVLNPAEIVVGGGLGLAAADWLLPGASAELKRRVPDNSFQSIRLARSTVTNSAVGAASLVWFCMGKAAIEERRSYEGKLTEAILYSAS